MTQATTATETLIDRYIAIWNETDGDTRRDLIAQTWATDATYRDPQLAGDGRDGIDAMTAGFQAAYPDHTFVREGTAEASGNELQFGWKLLNPAGDMLIAGSDVALLTADGQLASIVGTFDTP